MIFKPRSKCVLDKQATDMVNTRGRAYKREEKVAWGGHWSVTESFRGQTVAVFSRRARNWPE